MKAICNNPACKNSVYQTEFDVEDIDRGICPECDTTDISPSWMKDYISPEDIEMRKELHHYKRRNNRRNNK